MHTTHNRFKSKSLRAAAFLACAALLLFAPLRPVVKEEDGFAITSVDYYYKGLRQDEISHLLNLDDLAFMLQLYRTPLLPTAGAKQEMEAKYYLLRGEDQGRFFSIVADKNHAVLFYDGRNTGYRLNNGEVLSDMVCTAAPEHLQAELSRIIQ